MILVLFLVGRSLHQIDWIDRIIVATCLVVVIVHELSVVAGGLVLSTVEIGSRICRLMVLIVELLGLVIIEARLMLMRNGRLLLQLGIEQALVVLNAVLLLLLLLASLSLVMKRVVLSIPVLKKEIVAICGLSWRSVLSFRWLRLWMNLQLRLVLGCDYSVVLDRDHGLGVEECLGERIMLDLQTCNLI